VLAIYNPLFGMIVRMRLIAVLLSMLSLPVLAASEQALDKETLFQLLSAEFAIYREQFQQAQNIYLAEARELQDAGLAERATRLALHNQHYVDMLESAKIWLRKQPANAEAMYYLSLAYALTSQASLAMDWMEKVLPTKQATDFTQLVALLDDDTSNRNYYLSSLTQAHLSHPNNLDVLLALANLYKQADDKQQAMGSIEKLIALDKNQQFVQQAAQIYWHFNETDQAFALYQKALKKQPLNASYQQQLFKLAYQQSNTQSLQQLQFLVDKTPERGTILLTYASMLMDMKQSAQAKPILQRLSAHQDYKGIAHLYLGFLYAQEQQYQSALTELLAVQPGNEYDRAQEYIIKIHIEQEWYGEALNRIEKQLKLTLDSEQTQKLYLLKSKVLDKQGRTQEAYQLLSGLLDQQPDSFDLRYTRAMLAKSSEELPLRESDLRHILDKDPTNAQALNALGYTLADQTERYREALKLIEQANQLLPEEPAILDSMGWVLFRLGRLEEALAYLQKALDLMPDGEIAAHYAEVLWVSGKQKQAIDVLRNAIQKEPKNPVLIDTIERLNVSL
jgi:tetratricopeptide (TPR) repeat protein